MDRYIRRLRATGTTCAIPAMVVVFAAATASTLFAMTAEIIPVHTVPQAKSELVAGGIVAKLDRVETGATFPVGGSAFTTIHLSNQSKAKQVSAEIVLAPEVGEIAQVTGKAVTTVRQGANTLATVRNIRKGKPRTILVELRLKAVAGVTSAAGRSRNSLRIELRRTGTKDGAGSDDTILVWPVLDCATAFYSEISKLRRANPDGMGAALKAAKKPDKSRPGRWLFRPSIAKTVRRRVCARWVKTWQPFQGKYKTICSRYKTVRRTIRTASNLPKEEARVYRFANPFVAARAIDRQLSMKQNAGWVAQRVTTDLRGYLSQDKHPAICSGAVQMADYFLSKLAVVRERAGSIAEKTEAATALARAKTAAARAAMRADPSRHPPSGAAALDAEQMPKEPSLHDLVTELASLTKDAALLEAVRGAGQAFAGLRVMHKSLKTATQDLDGATRAVLRDALGAIEAADYLSVIDGHYKAIGKTITGSLSAIKEAHARSCLCGR